MVLNHNGIQTGDFVSQTFPYNNYYHFKTTFHPTYLNVLPPLILCIHLWKFLLSKISFKELENIYHSKIYTTKLDDGRLQKT